MKTFFRVYRAILLIAARLTPPSERAEWVAEWKAELWYLLASDSGQRGSALRFCLGSFRDALWLRRHRRDDAGERVWLRTPQRCVAILGALAALAWSITQMGAGPLRMGPAVMRQQVFILGVALLLLRIGTPLAHASRGGSDRLGYWSFFGLKFFLVLSIVFCGTFDLGYLLAAEGLRPHATLIGYVLGMRWVLVDQRQRCPRCLQRLTKPVRIGEMSHTLLEWCGTELMCSKGHGLMHVPLTTTSSYSVERWLRLDASWGGLFSGEDRALLGIPKSNGS